MMPTSRMCIRVWTCFITSAGHGRPAHQARSQARQVELAKLRVAEDADEHGRHAVERRAALGRDGFQHGERVERLGRDDQARPANTQSTQLNE